MIRTWLPYIFTLVACAPAYAQVPMTGAGLGTPATVFVGALDNVSISNPKMFGGFDCAKATYTGNVAKIIDSNLGTPTVTMSCTSGVLSASNGAGATLATLVTDCVHTNTFCTVDTIYDQSGATACAGSTACDLPFAAQKGPFLSDCPDFTSTYKFCLQENSAGWYYVTANALNLTATGLTMALLAYPSSTSAAHVSVFVESPATGVFLGSGGFRYQQSGGNLLDITLSAPSTAWHEFMTADANSTTVYGQLDNGSTVSGSVAGSATINGVVNLLNGPSPPGDLWDVREVMILSGDQHTVLTSIYSNALARVGSF